MDKLIISNIKFLLFGLTFILLNLSLNAFASDYNNKNEVKTLNKEEQIASEKIDSLIQTGRRLRYKYPDKAINVFNRCKEISRKYSLNDKLIDCYIQESAVYIIHSIWDSAHYYCDTAIFLADSLNKTNLLSRAYRLKAITYGKSGYSNTSLEYIKKSLKTVNEQDTILISDIYNTLGLTYKTLGYLDSATFYFLKGYNLLKLAKQEKKAYNQMINLADVLTQTGDYSEARFFLNEGQKSLEVSNEDNTFSEQSVLILIKLGSVFYYEQKYDSALYMFKKCEQMYQDINLTGKLINVYSNIGGVYSDLELYDSASFYYNLAIKIGENLNQENKLGFVLNNLSIINLKMGEFDKAIDNINKAINIAFEIGNKSLLMLSYTNIYKVYQKVGNYKQAFHYLLKSKTLSDSIFNIQKTKLISDLEMKYEKEKDQAHILSLKNENLQKNLELNKRTNQRNIFLAGGSGILVISILIFAFYRQRVKKDKIIADQRIEKLEREKKLLAAKSIVEGQEEERKRIARELHDGLGVLLSTAKMQFKTIEDKSPGNSEMIKKAAGLLEKASSDVRRISHNMMPGILTKLGLDEAIEDLFDNINDTPGITAILNITNEEEKRLPENTEIMIYRMVQEMVNNTLKYAGADKVTLDLIYEDETVSLQYSDNGKGFDVEEKLKNKSIGLTSIQSRVNFLGGKLNINSRPGRGTTFFINIPS
jgi:signal transduction histidine kinase